MQDSFGRTIDYLRISVTERCNLACRYCMPEGCGLEKRPVLSYEQIFMVAQVAVREAGFCKIRITGGEPLVRRDVIRLVDMLSRLKGPGGLEELAMTTNGQLLAALAADLRAAGLDSVNVSLDTLDERLYQTITGGGRIDAVLSGVRASLDAGLRVKINTVVFPPEELASWGPFQQDVDAVRAWAALQGAGHQRIARYHLDHAKSDPRDADVSRPPPCAACNRLRLLSDGTLRPCLHADIAVPVDFGDILGSLQRAVAEKPAHGTACTDKCLVQIGG